MARSAFGPAGLSRLRRLCRRDSSRGWPGHLRYRVIDEPVTPQSRKKLGRNANVEGLLALAQSDVRLSSLRSAFPYRAIAVVD